MQPLLGQALGGGLMDYLNQDKVKQANTVNALNQKLGPAAPPQMNMSAIARTDPFGVTPAMMNQAAPMDMPSPERSSLFSMIGQNFKQGLQDRIGQQDQLSPGALGSTALGQMLLKKMVG